MPTQSPLIKSSASGVSITRSAPKRCWQDRRWAREDTAVDADVLAENDDVGILVHGAG